MKVIFFMMAGIFLYLSSGAASGAVYSNSNEEASDQGGRSFEYSLASTPLEILELGRERGAAIKATVSGSDGFKRRLPHPIATPAPTPTPIPIATPEIDDSEPASIFDVMMGPAYKLLDNSNPFVAVLGAVVGLATLPFAVVAILCSSVYNLF